MVTVIVMIGLFQLICLIVCLGLDLLGSAAVLGVVEPPGERELGGAGAGGEPGEAGGRHRRLVLLRQARLPMARAAHRRLHFIQVKYCRL